MERMEKRAIWRNLKRRKDRRGQKKKYDQPDFTNPWPYVEELPPMLESMEVTKDKICQIECRNQYSIKPRTDFRSGKQRNDALYWIFSELVDKDIGFMRQWVQFFTLTHRTYLNNIASEYLKMKGNDLVSWTKSVKDGKRADVLTLFVLCLIKGMHAFVLLKDNSYWTSLKDKPSVHLEFTQWCNVHMSYLGRGIFVEHVLRMEIVSYKIFGVDQPLQMEKTKLVIIGTLTSDEDHTLNILLENLPTSSSNTGQHNSQRKSVLSIPLEMKSPRWPCETIKKTSTEASENVPVTQDALTTQTGDATLVSKTHLTGTTSLELVHNENRI